MSKRNILIVGGSLGIGKEIASGMAKRGERVIIADMNMEAGQRLVDELQADGSEAMFLSVDVSSWAQIQTMVQQVLSEVGTIDALIYSAGITRHISFDQLTFDEWKKTLSVNLKGLFHAAKAVVPAMIERRSGKIVIIGSASAITGSGGGVHYSVSKGGAFGFMRALARELGPHGINVNIVAPRVIKSEMLDRLYPTDADKERVKERIPIGRLGTAQDVANTVYFLCSKESDYVHGQTIILDGGRTYSG